MTSSSQDELRLAYIESYKDRLKHILYRLNHIDLSPRLKSYDNGDLIKEIILYFYCYKWLRTFVHHQYYGDVLFQSRHRTYDFLVDLLINSSDEEQFLKNYLLHCSKPENVKKAPHNYKASVFYEKHNQDLDACVSEILSVWNSLGYFKDKQARLISHEALLQKHIFNDIYNDTDRKRLRIIDNLSSDDRTVKKVHFEKLALIPTFKCSTGCRHCLFIWRPSLKPLYDRDKLFHIVNRYTKNVLFTGGDLTDHLEDFYDSLIKMDHVENFAILLNGHFAQTKAESDIFMGHIQHALKERKRRGIKNAFVTIQISFDEFHQEVLIDEKGKFFERVPVKNIVNILESSLPFDSIGIVLLHKQNPYNFSDSIVRKGVFARLMRECSQRQKMIKIVTIGKPQMRKFHPVTGKESDSMITDIHFVLGNKGKKVFTLNSSLVEALGRAKFVENTEYINALDVKDRAVSGNIRNEIFDSDLMFWYNGNVTSFAAPHLIFGNLFEDKIETIINRWQKDPLLYYLRNFNYRLIDFYKEISTDYDKIYDDSSSHLNLFTNLILRADVRLYLTQRILIELKDKGKINKRDFALLGIPEGLNELRMICFKC